MFVAGRDLRFARGRFALMGAVIVLLTLLVVLLSGLTAGLGRESTSAIADLPADQLVFSVPADGEAISFTASSVDERLRQQWQAVPGVTGAALLGVATTRARSGTRTAALSAFGVAPDAGLAPDGGRIGPGRVVLSRGAAVALDARVAAAVTLAGRRLTVAAIAGDASYGHTPVVWTSLADWRRLAPGGPDGRATVLALTTDSDAGLRSADARLGTRTVTRADALPAIGSYAAEHRSLQLMRGLLFAISALVVGAFFAVWTVQRGGDVAVLKALGASTGYLLRDALGQALVLLIAGTATGGLVAAAIGAAASGTVPLVLDATTVQVPAAVMTLLGMVGAGLSVRRITAVDPLVALGSVR